MLNSSSQNLPKTQLSQQAQNCRLTENSQVKQGKCIWKQIVSFKLHVSSQCIGPFTVSYEDVKISANLQLTWELLSKVPTRQLQAITSTHHKPSTYLRILRQSADQTTSSHHFNTSQTITIHAWIQQTSANRTTSSHDFNTSKIINLLRILRFARLLLNCAP